ncbi:hypothetical protein JD844_014992 [Phrynosoma platyrhinos]|uniref:2-methoxy-6-polyprenyl-1,4-benzoquinol methylase, mitochondrial n=1 Tax=Phrynosoma platyrhinos TaxID=52577 RepID=A0ABQ7T789_PHRPL|nr:hypothetical protein JD844_014992 [Phrynosoma platyrhinos]
MVISQHELQAGDVRRQEMLSEKNGIVDKEYNKFDNVLGKKSISVYQVFENVAKKYDLMNDSMSLGIHRVWKDILLRQMNPYPGTQLLDVAGGTGDIAFRFINYVRSQREHQVRMKLRSHQNLSWQEITNLYQEEEHQSLGGSHVVVCDINTEMLKLAWPLLKVPNNLGLALTNAFNILLKDCPGLLEMLKSCPSMMTSLTFTQLLLVSGMSLTLTRQALQEAYRILKPGGRFLCLEFSQVNNSIISSLYDLYSFQVIPVLGEVIAGDWKAYQYLVESIRRFPAQEEFKEMIEDAGFLKVEYHNLSSGIVAIHSGFKL